MDRSPTRTRDPVIHDPRCGRRAGAVWTQLGLRDDEAAARALAAGLAVVQSRCPAIEIPRLAVPVPSARGGGCGARL